MSDEAEFALVVSMATLGQIVHEAVRQTLESVGLDCANMPEWDKTPDHVRRSYVEVMQGMFHLEKCVDPRAIFEDWRREMEHEGWKYGREYSSELKTDPRMVSFDRLPVPERLLQVLTPFIGWAVVRALRSAIFAARGGRGKKAVELH